jgi:hypothetical protein
MNDIMDRMERAEVCYLALRLPRDGAEPGTYGGTGEEGVAEDAHAGRPGRRGRSKSKAGEMGVENRMVAKLEGEGGDDGRVGENEEEEVEEELKDFYDAPSAIVPLGPIVCECKGQRFSHHK